MRRIVGIIVLLGLGSARADKAAEIDALVSSFAEDQQWSGTVLVVEITKHMTMISRVQKMHP